MFLSALILALKYLQDRNYSARAWSKISGLKVCEINTNELAFLAAVNWKLHITDPVFERWQEIVLKFTPSAHPPPSPGACFVGQVMSDWKIVVPRLTPELDTVDVSPRLPTKGGKIPLRMTIPEPTYATDLTSSPTHKLPRFLEPRTETVPPTPSLARMGPLPTPILTPQSAVFSTPAVSAAAYGSRRPSMCTAMAQAQNACMSRTAFDQWNPLPKSNGLEQYQLCGRRPSLALSSTSLSSSPESMVSDNSSRSSRASSISSVSSAAWAPAPSQNKLARLATCRNARLPCVAPLKEKEIIDLTAEPLSSPDFSSFHLDDVVEVPAPSPLPLSACSKENARPQSSLSNALRASEDAAKTRKRGRSSADLSLHQEVRALLNNPDWRPKGLGGAVVLPDRTVAESCMLSQTPRGGRTPSASFAAKALQSPSERVSAERRKPVQKDLGRKRACCASEAQAGITRCGPGMWEGVL